MQTNLQLGGTVELADAITEEVQPNSYTIFERELGKLKDYRVLDGKFETSDNYIELGILNKRYINTTKEPIIYCIDAANSNNRISVEIESKTEKILYIVFDKNKMLNISREEMMRNYIKYLDLYIIDDWKFEGDKLVSKKAKLTVSIIENSTTYELSIHSINKNISSNYYIIGN